MPRVFIAMPFNPAFHPIYKVIRSACEQLGITTIRIDEVWARDDIYKQIEEEILKADFMIADFTGDRIPEVPNPNVVHEAAFARTHRKYVLLMAQDHQCLPFDWRTRPATIYQNSEEGLVYLKERLQMAMEALLKQQDFGNDPGLFQTATAPMLMPGNFARPMPGFVPGNPNMGFETTTQINIVENLLRAREGPVPHISSVGINLPPGFKADGTKVTCENDGSFMVRIAAVKFPMGSDEESDQKPVHEVYLSDYLIDLYPVSNGQFAKFIEAGGYRYQGLWSQEGWTWRSTNRIETPAFWSDTTLNRPDQPVVGVSWFEAMAYAVWAGKHLPTEAEWEYAARGTDSRPYPWGNSPPAKNLANYRGVAKTTTPGGQFPAGASPCGCLDMAGNVWEWCYDWYQEDYYGNSPRCNPVGSKKGKDKVCRGGAWTYDIDVLKTFYRFWGAQHLRDRGYGFRCARIL